MVRRTGEATGVSDVPRGPGWWQASDGRWYPPQSAPIPPTANQAAPYPGPQKVNGLAVASMVLGILWLWFVGSILALIFGYVSKSQIDKSRGTQSGRGMAVAGIVLGWVGLFFVLALIAAITLLGNNASSKFNTVASPIGGDTTTRRTSPIPSSNNAAPSAGGVPCVAVSDPLPPGAPDVSVKVGPPPAELVSEDLKIGNGAVVTTASTLSVNYIGVSCSTGKIFDSSYSRGQPASFPLANVIQGWQQGLTGMKVGGQRLLGIPPALAYGADGRPGIAPNETLWFVVEVLGVS
jgi:peptidylprolyl isomerase